jgi:hypothetical protein
MSNRLNVARKPRHFLLANGVVKTNIQCLQADTRVVRALLHPGVHDERHVWQSIDAPDNVVLS